MIKGTRLKQARHMRKAPTFSERVMWAHLKDRGLEGLRFRRQVPLGPYVADFVCHAHGIVVELDGPFHDPDRDRKRDDWLRAKGFEVLRFPIALIHNRPDLALSAIADAAARRSTRLGPFETRFLPPAPSPI